MNFDEIIERRNTDSIKYDATRRGMPEGLLPLWVADMDFRAPDCILEALAEKSRHGIFGYSESGQAYFEALAAWFKDRHGWEVKPEWLVKTPGVVFAVSTAVRALTGEGDGVIIQQPVYYPFEGAVRSNKRKLVVNELMYSEGRYQIDFEDFERKIIENQVKLFILCSPHNPVGRVWTSAELTTLGEICLRHDVVVVSDEIHADFVYPGCRHTVFSSLKPEFERLSVICTAPTKTFNLAGLQVSNIFIPDEGLRRAFRHELDRAGYHQLGIMGLVACKAAYEGGRPWLEALQAYLTENLSLIRNFLKERLPQVHLVEPEGTYLVWLDFKDLGLDDGELEHLIVHKARLWLDGGTMFGTGGSGFQRINIACPRSLLQKAMEQLEKAVKE